MKILKTIRDKDFGLDIPNPETYKERRAVRAIVFDKNNNIALIHASNNSYHTLHGGGIEEREGVIEALKRESLEEIGCEIKNIKELGIIEEYRNSHSLYQISYFFTAEVFGEKGIPQLEKEEIAEGYETIWVSVDDAISKLNSETSERHYGGKFMNLRNIICLKEVKRLLNL